MDLTLIPHTLSGALPAIASKSMAHRLLICAAFCPEPTSIKCETTSRDIEATISCLEALGTRITRDHDWLHVVPRPLQTVDTQAEPSSTESLLDCGESGSTLRFLLPVVCALGQHVALTGHGRLAQRPLSPLYEELVIGGANLSQAGTFPLHVSGTLRGGRFELPGDVSSQYVSGLLLAAPLLDSPSEIRVSSPLESRPYINLTRAALKMFGVTVRETHEREGDTSYTCFFVGPQTPYHSPGTVSVEGDWSNAAFWLAAGALNEQICVSNLDVASKQGDRAILAALAKFGARISRSACRACASGDLLTGCEIDVADFPDLVPPLAAVAACAPGTTRLKNCGRLRLKESDRIETVCGALYALGASITNEGDDIVIVGMSSLMGGHVDAARDHRIAMMAAIAASRCRTAVTIQGAECVEKSYPGFFDDYQALGGRVHIH